MNINIGHIGEVKNLTISHPGESAQRNRNVPRNLPTARRPGMDGQKQDEEGPEIDGDEDPQNSIPRATHGNSQAARGQNDARPRAPVQQTGATSSPASATVMSVAQAPTPAVASVDYISVGRNRGERDSSFPCPIQSTGEGTSAEI